MTYFEICSQNGKLALTSTFHVYIFNPRVDAAIETMNRVTLACFRNRRKPSSSGRRIRRAWPRPSMPLAVLPTRWMYSCGESKRLLRPRSGKTCSCCGWGRGRYLGVIRGVVLDDPVHLGDVQTSGRHVRAQQDARVRVAELEEGGGALRLLLLPLQSRGGSDAVTLSPLHTAFSPTFFLSLTFY